MLKGKPLKTHLRWHLCSLRVQGHLKAQLSKYFLPGLKKYFAEDSQIRTFQLDWCFVPQKCGRLSQLWDILTQGNFCLQWGGSWLEHNSCWEFIGAWWGWSPTKAYFYFSSCLNITMLRQLHRFGPGKLDSKLFIRRNLTIKVCMSPSWSQWSRNPTQHLVGSVQLLLWRVFPVWYQPQESSHQ